MQHPNPNFQNRTLYQMDNLSVLRGINTGTVDLIATDPPFNKGRDFHATPASLAAGASFQDRWKWKDTVQPVWVEQIEDGWPETHALIEAVRMTDESMAAYLCFMGVRLMEMERLLKPTGSLYVHCDPTAIHYLKTLMDTILGRANFRNEIVWAYSGGGIPRNDFPRKHDLILRYTKGDKWVFNVERKPYKENTQEVGIHSTLSGKDNAIDLERGTPITDWWTDLPTVTGWSVERTGYPTQKPLALYERIIAASSNPGDVVLDPFAGCATTCVAAERLGRQWIGIDYWDGTIDLITQRLSSYIPSVVWSDNVTHVVGAPVRTDGADVAAPAMATSMSTLGFKRRRWSDREMRDMLFTQWGTRCWACDFAHPDPAFYDLDHITPKSIGGPNDLSNRAILCKPCNQHVKRDSLTLAGVRHRRGYTGRNVHPIDAVAARDWAVQKEQEWDRAHPTTTAFI